MRNRGQSHFSWFFLVEKSHFGTPKSNFSRFEKWKARIFFFLKSLKSLLLLRVCNVFSFNFNFPPSFFRFSFFMLHFPYFSWLSFPDTSAEISQSEVWRGTLLPPYPPPVTPLSSTLLTKDPPLYRPYLYARCRITTHCHRILGARTIANEPHPQTP